MYEKFFLHFRSTSRQYPLLGEVIAGKSRDLSSLYLVPYFKGPVKTISRRHFKLFYQKDRLFIEDLESSNGTEVNGELLQAKKPRWLFHGDTIRIAKNDDFVIEVISENKGTDIIEPATTPPLPPPPPIPEQGIYFQEHEETFYVDAQAVRLAPVLYDLLKYLYDHQGRVCGHVDFIREVWHGGADKSLVTATVRKLRKQFNKASSGAGKRYIKTISGYGYKLIIE